MKKRKTVFTKKENLQRSWYKIDAAGLILGRLATKAAVYLSGKHKPCYTPQTDCGDYIVVINADKVKVSGNKAKLKTYFTHSGHPGGDMLLSWEKMMVRNPVKVIQLAVAGMLPHNRIGAQMLKKMKVFVKEPSEFKKVQKLEV